MFESLLDRAPNQIELAMFGVMWSEYCAFKNSKALLKKLPGTSHQAKVLASQAENAGIIDCGGGISLILKSKSHNHRTFVEPFQGAANLIGKILQDILISGTRPIAFLNSLHFGSPSEPKYSHLLEQAIAGLAHYRNSTGIPMVVEQVTIDGSYVAYGLLIP